LDNLKQQKETIVQLLKYSIPQIEDALEYMEENQGWLPMKEEFVSNLYKSGLSNWSEYYLDERKIKALALLNYYNPEELNNISDYKNERQRLYNELVECFETDDSFLKQLKEEEDKVLERFYNSNNEEQKEISTQIAIAVLCFLTSFFNYLALMVHGRSMCRLVNDAINGDDKALALAVQIDRTVLNLPYFQERMLKAQLGKDPTFLDQVSYRLRNPILRGKIRYRTLWATFAVLDDEGLLSLPHEEILDICEEAGVYGKNFGIEDVGHLSSRLREYRRFQTK
jgi:hypothetical protein